MLFLHPKMGRIEDAQKILLDVRKFVFRLFYHLLELDLDGWLMLLRALVLRFQIF